jgi:hypothetical protein
VDLPESIRLANDYRIAARLIFQEALCATDPEDLAQIAAQAEETIQHESERLLRLRPGPLLYMWEGFTVLGMVDLRAWSAPNLDLVPMRQECRDLLDKFDLMDRIEFDEGSVG